MTFYLVDDSEMIRRRLRRQIVRLAGSSVIGEATNVADAAAALQLLQPDAVIVDLQLQNSSGLDLIRAMPKSADPVRIVFSSHADAATRDACLEAGAHFVFHKTRDLTEFLDTLQSLAIPSPIRALRPTPLRTGRTP